jgi:uncharacterized protein with HEPN domain
MKKRDYTDYLIDIKSECEFLINESNKIDYNTFASSDTLIRAFIRSLRVIGEATKHIPSYHRNKYPDIQWKSIIGMRNILIHEYFGVDYYVIWITVKNKIPLLYDVIKKMINDQ